jgi:hypothetical protein
MDVAPFVALAVLALVTTAGNFLWPSRRARINRAVASRPRALVHDAHGTVRLTGRVRPIGDLLRAPLTGRPCLAYEVVVDQPGSGGWWRCVELREVSPFLVVDESGEARIDPSGPFLMSLRYHRTGDTGVLSKYPDMHEDLASLLSTRGVVSTTLFGRWRRFRYGEAVLAEGGTVSVSAGSFHEVDPTGERVDQRSPPERVVLRGTEALPLLISDEKEDHIKH